MARYQPVREMELNMTHKKKSAIVTNILLSFLAAAFVLAMFFLGAYVEMATHGGVTGLFGDNTAKDAVVTPNGVEVRDASTTGRNDGSESAHTMTAEQFAQCDNGMTYREVAEIAGSEGDSMGGTSSDQEEGPSIEYYAWQCADNNGIMYSFSFVDGSLTHKGEVNLEEMVADFSE